MVFLSLLSHPPALHILRFVLEQVFSKQKGSKTVENIDEKSWKALKTKLARSKVIETLDMGDSEIEYVQSRGVDILQLHAADFVRKRLAPAEPKNDGRQTPLKGHPVFIAQHATGTSDREKLKKFHGIEQGIELTDNQVDYIVDIIIRWIEEQVGEPA
jgi:hypothetical protein